MQRMRTDGVFDAPTERATDQEAEKSLSEFSRRAQGEKTTQSKVNSGGENPDTAMDALSSLEGSVAIRDGIASTGRLRFKIAGAEADLRGTFNFHNENVHLIGTLRMDTDISHTTTGFKSWLLKPLAPFFKQKRTGTVVPIAVTGSPGNYKVTQNIVHQQ